MPSAWAVVWSAERGWWWCEEQEQQCWQLGGLKGMLAVFQGRNFGISLEVALYTFYASPSIFYACRGGGGVHEHPHASQTSIHSMHHSNPPCMTSDCSLSLLPVSQTPVD